MDYLSDFNGITVLYGGIFLIPVAAGILNAFPGDRIRNSFLSLLGRLGLIAGIILTLYFYKMIFCDRNSNALNYIYQFVPFMEDLFAKNGNHFTFSVIFLFLCLFAILLVFHLIIEPFNRFAVIPMTNRISAAVNSMNGAERRIIGGVWKLPKALWYVLVFSLILNFYTFYDPGTPAAQYIGSSSAYSAVNEKVLHPLLNSEPAKKLPVLIRDSIAEINQEFYAEKGQNSISGTGDTAPVDSIFPVIEFFNGVTLDEAVASTKEIDAAAEEIASSGKNDKEKAYLIYQWISKNIKYDHEKAEALITAPDSIKSGAQIAFTERKGICFDYSALYVSMCRAVGLKVRLITGLGYNGSSWDDHAWNQVYATSEDRWINVDATFGSTGHRSFDSTDFTWIHKDGDIQGEW